MNRLSTVANRDIKDKIPNSGTEANAPYVSYLFITFYAGCNIDLLRRLPVGTPWRFVRRNCAYVVVVGQVLGFVLNVPIRNRTASRPCTLRTEWAGYHAAAAAAARLPLSPPVDCMFQTNGRTVANHPSYSSSKKAPETCLSTSHGQDRRFCKEPCLGSLQPHHAERHSGRDHNGWPTRPT